MTKKGKIKGKKSSTKSKKAKKLMLQYQKALFEDLKDEITVTEGVLQNLVYSEDGAGEENRALCPVYTITRQVGSKKAKKLMLQYQKALFEDLKDEITVTEGVLQNLVYSEDGAGEENRALCPVYTITRQVASQRIQEVHCNYTACWKDSKTLWIKWSVVFVCLRENT